MPLYSFGSNSSSQLSLSHTDDVSIPTPCLFLSKPPAGPPKAIVAGGNHTILLYSSGEAFVTGNNSSGQCGLIPEEVGARIDAFTQFPSPPLLGSNCAEPGTNIESTSTQWGLCTAGWEFTVLVTNDGKRVYVCGGGSKGELGLGPSITSTLSLADNIPSTTLHLIPSFPPENTFITFLTSSITHVIAVLNTGAVYGWGMSRKGQLTPPSQTTPPKTIPYPTLIPLIPFPVARGGCTQETTLLLSADGTQHLLLSSSNPKWSLLSCLPLQSHLKDTLTLCTSWNGIYALLSTGALLAWGKSDHGQIPSSTMLAAMGSIQQIAIGSEHGLAVVTRDGDEERLVAWGWGEHGNCGRLEKGDVAGVREVHIPPPDDEMGRRGALDVSALDAQLAGFGLIGTRIHEGGI
ncbi:regulator of chromosome condensation 1/beta-lactamase-inhibitor protein II [Kalaharituber pfeilii]|nr:regulator of chromosome condensation 1/beta-lactamase-inhibitor protein II [Kalaharituber pfeilii]